ncbi:MAG: hypothetical protein GKB99_00300 [Methanocellales archaeon]|nr:hypothetical protein [Methanocellales archaeon]
MTLNASITNGEAGVKNASVNVSAINSTLNEVVLERQGDYWINTTIIADRGETAELQNLTITTYDNVSNVNNSVNMTVGIYLKLPDLNMTSDYLQITYSEPEIQDRSNLTINATVHNTGNDNATDVNVSLYIDEEYDQSINIPLINLSENSTATLYWIASPGPHNITIMVDPLDTIEELNETNNNATNSTIVKKLVVMDIIYPLNGTDIPRGGYHTDGYKEDVYNIVDDNLTITTRVYNYYNSSDSVPESFANCSFYWNGSLIGYNETNSTGYCHFSYNKTQYNYGYYNITVNFTINASYSDNYTTNATLNESTNAVKLSVYEIALTKTNTKVVDGDAVYREGDAAILVINVTKDGVLHNVTEIIAFAKKPPDIAVVINYYDGFNGIEQVGTGRYYVRTIVNESFSAQSIKWTVWVRNNGENVSSSGHSEVNITSSNADLNINVTNENETIEDTNISIYDANLERRIIKELILLNKSTLKKNGLSKKATLGDNYTIEISTPTNESLIIRELNLSSTQLNVSPQIITNYTGTKPTEVKEMSNIIAVDISDFNNATLIFPKGINVDTICRADDWNFTTASADNWICNDTSDYEGFGYNDTHFWFTVDHFTAYAGGQTKNSLMAIWDETDTGVPYANKTRYVNENVTFFANYTSSEGSLISDGNCTVWFNDTGEWYTMDYNDTSHLYEYIRSFSTGGIFNYTVNCNHSTYDNLSASDNVNITPDTTEPNVTYPVVEEAVNNWVKNNTRITFKVNINDARSVVSNATVNVSLINVTGGIINLTNVPGTDYWTNDTIIADISTTETKNLTITSYDSSGNCNSSVNFTLGVDGTLPTNGVSPTREGSSKTWIKWTWTNPSIDVQPNDFSHTMIYINGNWVANVSNTTNYYNATGLNPGSTYEISIRTVDLVGNMNASWSNDTEVTIGQQPIGGIAVIVIPKINETTAGNSTNFTIRVRSTQSFQDAIELDITLSDVPDGEQANLSWFNWTSESFLLPANEYIDKTVRVEIPDGTSTGYKVFCAIARASLGTSKDFGAVNVTG